MKDMKNKTSSWAFDTFFGRMINAQEKIYRMKKEKLLDFQL